MSNEQDDPNILLVDWSKYLAKLVGVLADVLNSDIRMMITESANNDNYGVVSYCSIIDDVLKTYGIVCMVNGTSLLQRHDTRPQSSAADSKV